jgi:hypothetical protein
MHSSRLLASLARCCTTIRFSIEPIIVCSAWSCAASTIRLARACKDRPDCAGGDEGAVTRRTQITGRGWRWPNNLGIVAIDALLVRILFRTSAVGLALIAAAHGLGLFNVVPVPAWIGLVASVILERFDGVLQWFVVTPDMHRVHHSILSRETNSNFGFNLPWWDRLFGTYRAQPAAGHEAMTIGIEQFREPRELGIDRMLLQPFRGDAGRYPLGEGQVEQ